MALQYIRLEHLTDAQWADAHAGFYNLKVVREMGGEIYTPLSLHEFYDETMTEIEEGRLVGWAIIKGDEYLGHMMLVNKSGEWEIGVAIIDEARWGSGVGIRAGLYALRFAFEELGTKQVIAFFQGRNPDTKEQFLRIGFRPFLNFLIMPVEVYDTKWRGRIKDSPTTTEDEE